MGTNLKVPPEIPETDKTFARRARSLFFITLLAITVAGLVVRVEIGRRTFIDFDEWQHVFMAGTPRWTDLFFELRTNAHPILFFLLLRGIVRLGHVALYRSVSIAAGTGSILLVGLIARRIFRSPAVQLLCAAAFALSAAAISISVEIRSYQLTVFLVLGAFWAWLSIFPETAGIDGPARGRACLTFGICSALAVMSHYSAVFFLGACAAVPVVIAAVSPPIRKRWLSPIERRSLCMCGAAFAAPCAIFTVEYFEHIRKQLMQGYAAEFYRGGTPGETAGAFVVRNSRNFFNLFSPFEARNTTEFLAAMAIACAAAVWLFRRRHRWTMSGAATIVFAAAIVLELMVASLARKYPFGGLLRHQYIAGPFLLIAAFVLVDAVVAASGPMLRRAVPALLMAGLVLNLAVAWPKLIVYPGAVLEKAEFDTWQSAFANTHAVYLDHWGVIGYFIHTSDRPRKFVRRIADIARIDQYGLPDGTQIFYDKSRDNLDLADPSVYRSFAACLRGSGVHELSLFFFRAGDIPFPESPAEMEKLVAQKAAEQGLAATRVIASPTALFAAFRVKTD